MNHIGLKELPEHAAEHLKGKQSPYKPKKDGQRKIQLHLRTMGKEDCQFAKYLYNCSKSTQISQLKVSCFLALVACEDL